MRGDLSAVQMASYRGAKEGRQVRIGGLASSPCRTVMVASLRKSQGCHRGLLIVPSTTEGGAAPIGGGGGCRTTFGGGRHDYRQLFKGG